MSNTPSCPDRDVLRRFLAGVSSAEEQQWLEEHLEECAACQADLDALDAGDESWVGRVKDLGREQSEPAPGLKRIMGVLKDEGEPDPDTTGFASVRPEEILAFLDPADSPEDLGKLASYRVLEVLGEGGMGVVLKAIDPALHRAVAIKVLAPQLATSSSARQRFAREARAAAAIRNEHVVAIHSVDEWKGLPYLVMEFIPGASLQERIDRTGPLDLNSILRIGMQAASGLAAAHAQGLVHRDIKPSNILLENCVERVKITDFGLARAVDDASLTQSGVVAGTPLFMAPEQARCESIDHRADLFSLGAVLYAMCTGRSPFRAPTTMGVLRRVCDDVHRPVREVNPEIPVELAAIIDRLLAKEPAQRFQTAAEVAEKLEQLLARRQQGWSGESEVDRAPVDDVGPLKRPRRHRMLQAAAYLLVLLSGAFVVAEGTGTTRVIDTIATVLRIKTPGGTLVLQVFDPEMKVQVDGQSVTFRGPGSQAITINPGAHRVDKVDPKGNVSTEWISISRGDKLLVSVGREPDQPLPTLPKARIGTIATLKTEVKGLTEVMGLHGQLAFAMGGRYLVGAGPGAELCVYDTSKNELRSHAIEGGDVKALEVNNEIRCVLTASADGKVRIWDIFPLAEGDWPMKPHATPDLHGLNVTAMAMSKDSKLLALGGADGKLVVWDRGTDIRDDLAIHLGHAITSIRFSADDALLAVGLMGGGVKLWNVVRHVPGQLDRSVQVYDQIKDVQFLEFSHDGRYLVVASDSQTIVVDLHHEQSRNLPGWSTVLPCRTTAMKFSASCNMLAVGLDNGSAVFWDADGNRQQARIPASINPIVGLAFSPTGRLLATWGRGDASTKIWDLGTTGGAFISGSNSAPEDPFASVPQPPLKAVDSSQIPVQQAIGRFREAQAARDDAQGEVQRAKAELEIRVAKAALATKKVARMEELLAQGAIEQRLVDEAMDECSMALSQRQSAEAAVKIAEIKLRAVNDEVAEAQNLLDAVSAPGPDTPEKREAVLRVHAQTAVRGAQTNRDLAAAELDVFKATLAGAVANREYRTKVAVRMRQLVERKAVEQRLLDEAENQESAAGARVRLIQVDVNQAENKLKEAEQKLHDVKANPYDSPRDVTKAPVLEEELRQLLRQKSGHHD